MFRFNQNYFLYTRRPLIVDQIHHLLFWIANVVRLFLCEVHHLEQMWKCIRIHKLLYESHSGSLNLLLWKWIWNQKGYKNIRKISFSTHPSKNTWFFQSSKRLPSLTILFLYQKWSLNKFEWKTILANYILTSRWQFAFWTSFFPFGLKS